MHDNRAGTLLLDPSAAQNRSVQKALVDQGVPQAKRWVVGRTYGILLLHRRLVWRVLGPESVLVSRGRRLWGSGRRGPGHDRIPPHAHAVARWLVTGLGAVRFLACVL